MILLVDHKDSFTRNLEHLLASFDQVLVRDRKELEQSMIEDAELIVLSPGPGKPSDYPETSALLRPTRGKTPVLGICLGFQLILESEGAEIGRQSQVLHGVCTEIRIDPSSATYSGFPSSIEVGRYHSLQVEPASLRRLAPSLRITAEDHIRGVPLSFEDLERRLFGLQYHPESFLTRDGQRIIENIRNACLDEIG